MITEFTIYVMRGLTDDEMTQVMSGVCDILTDQGLANDGVDDDDEVLSVVVAREFSPSDSLEDEEIFASMLDGAYRAVLPLNKEVTVEGDS